MTVQDRSNLSSKCLAQQSVFAACTASVLLVRTAPMRPLSDCTKALLMISLTLIAYLPASHNGFIWDDDAWLMKNQTLYGWSGLHELWFNPLALQQYYPVTGTAFWIEYQFWRFDPFGYHIVNVLFHALNAVLFALILRKLRLPAPWFAAAIFAVHPVMVESVAWITEIKNTLSTAFFLASVLTFLRFENLEESEPSRHWKWFVFSLFLFFGALLSKSVTCTLPVVLALLIWWKRARSRPADFIPLVPYFFLAIPIALLTAWLETHHVGATGSDWTLSAPQRVMLAGRVVCFYFAKIVWPANLTFIYSRWRLESVWLFLFGGAVLAGLALLWILRRRFGKGPFVAIATFIVTLGPILGFMNCYGFQFSYVADHWQYLASLCLISLATAIGGRLRNGSTRVAVLTIPIFVLGLLTWRQCPIYRNVETLWRDTLAKNPDCWLAHHNLGVLLQTQNHFSEAEAHFRFALQARPDYYEAENNLGESLLMQDRLNEAEEHIDRSIALNPAYAASRWNRALLYVRERRKEEAFSIVQDGLAQSSVYLDGLNTFARFLATTDDSNVRDPQTAELLARRGCEFTHYFNAYFLDTLAVACAAQGRYTEANDWGSRALIVASRSEDHELAREINGHLKLYRSHKL
jgi:protein O-mannosyl-transferase